MCYFDVHSHILPGVDDGAKDMEETLQMLTMAYDQGIRIIAATPHYMVGRNNVSADRLKELLSEVQQEAAKVGLNLNIILGNELFYSFSIIEELNRGNALTIAGTRYILIEFHTNTPLKQIREGLNSCILAGYIPILAHAERYSCLIKKPKLVEELLDLGTYIQINLNSIAGRITNPKVRFCRKLLKKGWVHFLGTDAHGAQERMPQVTEAIVFLKKKYGEKKVRQLFYENPLNILQNKHINQITTG